MIRAGVAAAVLLAAAWPAAAQTPSLPTSGGAVVSPTPPNLVNPAASAGATGAATTGAVGSTASGSRGRGAASASRSGAGGGSFVLCPPSGASGEAAFLIGTDLSCAPR